MDNAIKAACLEIFAEFRANIENGRITSTQDVLTEVTNCMVQVQHLATPAPPSPPAVKPEEIANIHVYLADIQGKMTRFEDSLTGLRSQTADIGQETARLLEEQKDNTKTILAAIGNVMDSRAPAPTAQPVPANSAATHWIPASSAPANSDSTNPDPTTTTRRATSYPATVFFPGGSRTITVHPPGTPGYQSIVRDGRGDVILDFRRYLKRPLRREGAFRGSPDEDDYLSMQLIGGRGPQPADKPVPPVPRWPDQSQPSPSPSRRSCGPSDLIARQRQLAESMETDEYGRIIPPDYANQLDAPGLPAGAFTSPLSSQDSQASSSSNVENEGVSTPSSSTPPSSPSSGRGKKRTRASEDAEDGGLKSAPGDEKPTLSVIETPETPASIKHEESNPPEGPSKRRKLRSSAPLKRSVSTRSISRTYTMADVTLGS